MEPMLSKLRQEGILRSRCFVIGSRMRGCITLVKLIGSRELKFSGRSNIASTQI
jgi:hypothetical protein